MHTCIHILLVSLWWVGMIVRKGRVRPDVLKEPAFWLLLIRYLGIFNFFFILLFRIKLFSGLGLVWDCANYYELFQLFIIWFKARVLNSSQLPKGQVRKENRSKIYFKLHSNFCYLWIFFSCCRSYSM